MKYAIAIIVFLGAVACANSATVPVTVPDEAVPGLQALCAAIQAELQAKTFTNSECGTYLVRIGARLKRRQILKQQLREAGEQAVVDDLVLYDEEFPQQYVQAVCGDGEVDAITNETCDDGNTESGDGCSSTCQTE